MGAGKRPSSRDSRVSARAAVWALAGFLVAALVVPRSAAQENPRKQKAHPHGVNKVMERDLRRGLAAASPRPGRPNWSPPDVDETVPPVTADVSCALPEVLASAGQRVKELLSNLEQFAATERIEKQEVNENGKVRFQVARSFNYVVSLREIRPGWFSVDEDRNNGQWPTNLQDSYLLRYETYGLAALALIFHPSYQDDFQMSCEGLGSWHGQPAWLVRFAQRPDRPSRIRGFRLREGSFAASLKGRAWIAPETGQVVRLETDLAEPIPQIRLQREHLIIEYHPVQFRARNLQLWLPERAQLYMDIHGHRFHHTHSYSDYLLFSVEERQQIQAPSPQRP